MVIYLDVLVFINIFVTYFLLLSSGFLLHRKAKKWRTACGAIFGGLSALVIFLPPMPGVFFTAGKAFDLCCIGFDRVSQTNSVFLSGQFCVCGSYVGPLVFYHAGRDELSQRCGLFQYFRGNTGDIHCCGLPCFVPSRALFAPNPKRRSDAFCPAGLWREGSYGAGVCRHGEPASGY